MPNDPDEISNKVIERLKSHDIEAIESIRREKNDNLQKVKAAPVEAQIAFIKELLKNKAETDAFLRDPKQYAVDHGILFSPEVVKAISNSILYDVTLEPEMVNGLGEHALQDIVDMREGRPVGVNSNAAVAAAVVVAAAAVVTAVVTVVRTDRPADLISLSGLGRRGVVLPGGIDFVSRDVISRNVNPRDRGWR